MKLEEYKSQAITRLNKSIAHNEKEKMNYACMGLFEETGEVIAEFRKPLFKGNFHEKPLDIEDIKSELGDLMWYLALICKNTDIDMNQFKPIYNDKEKINKREKIIQIALKMGKQTGKIIEEYEKVYIQKTEKEELISEIQKQYNNICELVNQIDINIDDILNENIRKINSRYNEKGEKENVRHVPYQNHGPDF